MPQHQNTAAGFDQTNMTINIFSPHTLYTYRNLELQLEY